ncbi:MAG: hypothetical protein NVV74_11365 [Magnetospirillum sp.]|nr:hypothetical protein [Magnetospirillum sp.]
MRHPFVIAAALVAVLAAAPAWAHKMKVFATAEGSTVSGYAYFNADSRAIQSKVVVAGPDGSPVFEGATDEHGQFAFQATRRMDHIITVDGGDGHVASFTVTAAELPDNLPAGTAAAPTPLAATNGGAAPAADLHAAIEQAVVRQIRPLREQIDAYQEKIWWHDVLGGIGYIIGMAGLAFGLANRKRPPQAASKDKTGP